MSKATTWLSKSNQIARAFAMGAPGSEAAVLELVAQASVRGEVVLPELQKIANAILAAALSTGKLPQKASGRPKDENLAYKAVERVYRFFELVDQNTSGREEALMLVAAQLPASIRHIERSIEDYAWVIGGGRDEDFDARHDFRIWRSSTSAEVYKEVVLMELRFHSGASLLKQRPLKELLADAPDRVTAMRVELRRLVDLATRQSTVLGR